MGLFTDIYNLLFPSTPPSPVVPHTTATDVLDALNVQRVKFGFAPLKLDNDLNRIAQSWAVQMAKEARLYHGDFAGRISHTFPNTAAVEDIAEGQPTVDAVVKAWMNSAPHRANILGNYYLLGVGQAKSAGGEIFWVVDFDRPNGPNFLRVVA